MASGIIYALVARGDTVLAEHTASTGTFTTVARQILAKIPSSGETSRLSYSVRGCAGLGPRWRC